MIEIIGKHRVQHGNMMDGVDLLMEGKMADLIYCDPPWGSSTLKYWETLRIKMDSVSKPRIDVALDPFLEKMFSICQKYAKNFILIEYGQKWKSDIIMKAKKHGFSLNGTVETRYSSQHLPLDLHVFSKTGGDLPTGFVDLVNQTKGYDTVKKAFSFFKYENGIVLDLCCGMGYTAKGAIDNGMSFRGNEMNAKRLEKTKARLRKDV